MASLWATVPWAQFTLARKIPGAIFLKEGSEFMAPHIRERKTGREQCFSLNTVAI